MVETRDRRGARRTVSHRIAVRRHAPRPAPRGVPRSASATARARRTQTAEYVIIGARSSMVAPDTSSMPHDRTPGAAGSWSSVKRRRRSLRGVGARLDAAPDAQVVSELTHEHVVGLGVEHLDACRMMS